MIHDLTSQGVFIHECPLAGERRMDGIYPAHPNGAQASRTRFLIVYATRSNRGVDDDLSIVYQLRAGSYDGPVLAERVVAKSVNDWHAFDDDRVFVRQHGHPCVFGVPKGAVVNGRPAPSAGVFAILWRRAARELDPATGLMRRHISPMGVDERAQGTEWTQVRLSDDENSIEVVQPMQLMRQTGYEGGPRISNMDAPWMIQSYTQPVPFNEDGTEWAGLNNFGGGRIAALKYRFIASTSRYEWAETGQPIAANHFEPSLAPYRDGWVISARPFDAEPVHWMRTDDPFREAPKVVLGPEPIGRTPLTLFRYGDGQLRLMAGDRDASPYGLPRNPLYLWDVDPDRDFALSNRRVVYDTLAMGLPIPQEASPVVDMAKALPHAGGDRQVILHRVRSRRTRDTTHRPSDGTTFIAAPITPVEEAVSGIYAVSVRYTEPQAPMWEFD